MGESRQQATTSSRLALRSGGGEIVEVQGGHIVRSTGRKDRHSKVCTAKGPRDRRVRLSAPTAIQFYDVQDRLGYDRPSKAVDWLIKKAKAAIDELPELPAWDPHATNASLEQEQQPQPHQQQQPQMNLENENENSAGVRHRPSMDTIVSANRRAAARLVGGDVGHRPSDCTVRNLQQRIDEHLDNHSSSFLPPSLESDSIVETIKSFFPMGARTETPQSTIQFQSYPPDLLSRTSSHSQDLRLSLQSIQDPVLLHHQHHQAQHQTQPHNRNEHVFFSGTNQLGFDGSSTGWSEQPQAVELGRFQRLVAWNSGAADTGTSGHGGSGVSGGAGAFHFNSPPPTQTQLPPPLQPFIGQSQFLSQRGPLQSSNTPLFRAWIDPSVTANVTDNHHQNQHSYHLPQSIHPSLSGFGFTSGQFSDLQIPARIQGEEEYDGISDKPSSASSDSRHQA